ncbi:MAG TPA: TIGR03790 family protein [Opitutaceae bacterium]|nr:TIGR03790 family protein [Opitutaceae bacterium]
MISATARSKRGPYKRRISLCWLLLATFLWRADPIRAADDPLAARVIILANSDDPDSLRIARHYAEVRSVPPANIFALRMPVTETVTWREFVATIWHPLLTELVRAKWIDAIPMSLADPVGRQKYAPFGHRIAALVVCRGVPLKINHDALLYSDVPPFTARTEFRTNAGAVDAELSLLSLPNYPINAFVPNPLFQNDRPAAHELTQVVKVSRLDGPTADAAHALVDRAVQAEKTGLLGRAYVDLSERDPVGNAWLEAAAKQLGELGFDLSVDRDPATLRATARFDAPALYFGWYASDLDGPFTLPGFQFPPGAIALHIHSYSAATLRSASTGWTGPLVARGVTATVGNVHEPYLQLTHRPDALLRALARGATLVDAAYYALTALSWQAVLIGDPLYRPFAVPLGEQLKPPPETPSPLTAYAILRQVNVLEAEGRRDEAVALARAAQTSAPSLAIGLALARRLHAGGDNDAAASALGFAGVAKTFAPNEWALAREAAQFLESAGRPRRALEIWQTLLAIPALPAELRAAWLPEARKAALAAKDDAQAEAWNL